MLKYKNKNNIECGVDECGRGSLFGRIYSAAVIYPSNNLDENIEKIINDSKKLSKKKRELIYNYLIKNVKYGIAYLENDEIDKIGIQKCNYKVMHNALNNLNIPFNKILVDGKLFEDYNINNNKIDHECIIKGDSKYFSIAAASIIAKVEHDKYIENFVKLNNKLEKYDLLNNMGYGTKNHINAIKKYGLTEYHRKSYKIKSLIKQ